MQRRFTSFNGISNLAVTASGNSLLPCTSHIHGRKPSLKQLNIEVVKRADDDSNEVIFCAEELLKRELTTMENVYKHREEVIKRVEKVKKEKDDKAEKRKLEEIEKLKRKAEVRLWAILDKNIIYLI